MKKNHRKSVKYLLASVVAVFALCVFTTVTIDTDGRLAMRSGYVSEALVSFKNFLTESVEPNLEQGNKTVQLISPAELDARVDLLLRQTDRNERFLKDADNAFVHVPRQLQANEQLIAKINNDLRAAQESLQLKREFDGHIQAAIASSQQQSKIEAVQLRETSYDIGQQIGQGRLPDEVLHNVERSTGISTNEINELFNR